MIFAKYYLHAYILKLCSTSSTSDIGLIRKKYFWFVLITIIAIGINLVFFL